MSRESCVALLVAHTHRRDEGVKCTSPQVGFYLDNNYLTKMSDDDVHKKDFRTMTAVMITNPLTAAFGGLSLILSFLLVRVGREVVSIRLEGLPRCRSSSCS